MHAGYARDCLRIPFDAGILQESKYGAIRHGEFPDGVAVLQTELPVLFPPVTRRRQAE